MSHSNYLSANVSDNAKRTAKHNDMTFNSNNDPNGQAMGVVTETDAIYSRIRQQRAERKEAEIERIKA